MKIFFSNLLLVVSLFGIDLSQKAVSITEVKEQIATIDKANLKVGQSGIVVHEYSPNESIILSQGVVIESNSINSRVKLFKSDIFSQSAIPTSKLAATTKDKFILNHLYGTSLLIVPNYDTKVKVKDKFPNQYFFNEDNFASYLKLVAKPIPEKKQIQEFCNKNQIGTIFVVVSDNLYILDAVSFKIIGQKDIDVKNKDVKVPFFSKIDTIEKGFWDFGEDQVSNYKKHYLKVIGL